MSQLVLARKYRPRTFSQMVGQDSVVRALTHALASGRLHHAYLFTGTRGIGKTTVSRILAKSLNCTGPDGRGGVTAEPCGVCQACVEIDQDRYIDYVELDAASNRGIDEARDLIERAAYKPGVGRFKVFMIDEAHQLTKDAFSALLKTLEEPPDYLKFVLATTDPDRMLPTVLSRCLQFNLRPMPPDTVAAHLREVLAAEVVACDEGALRLLSRAARGSMRDALSLTDQAIAFGGGQIDEAQVREMLGSVDRSHAAALIEALARRDGAALLAQVDALRNQGLSPTGALDEITRLLQLMAVEQAVPGALDATDPDTEVPRRLSGLMPADETQLIYSIALHGRAELGLMSDEYGALTMVLLRVFAFPGGGTGAMAGSMVTATPTSGPPRATAPGLPSGPAPTQAVDAVRAAPVPAPNAAPPRRAEAPLRASAESARTAVPVAPIDAQARPATAGAAPKSATGVGTGTSSMTPASTRTPAVAAPQAAYRSPALPARPEPASQPQAAARAVAPSDEPPPWADMALPDEDFGAVPSQSTSDGDDGRPEGALPSPATARTDTDKAAPAAASRLQPTALGEKWAEAVRAMSASGAISALVRESAMQAEWVNSTEANASAGDGRSRECWRLRIEREALRAPALIDKLQTALALHLGRAVQLVAEAGVVVDTPALRDTAARERAQRDAETAIRDDAAVQALLARFKTARIVPGSIKPN
jgi:DNA polymerase-3 subunit gamma/tau